MHVKTASKLAPLAIAATFMTGALPSRAAIFGTTVDSARPSASGASSNPEKVIAPESVTKFLDSSSSITPEDIRDCIIFIETMHKNSATRIDGAVVSAGVLPSGKFLVRSHRYLGTVLIGEPRDPLSERNSSEDTCVYFDSTCTQAEGDRSRSKSGFVVDLSRSDRLHKTDWVTVGIEILRDIVNQNFGSGIGR
jgi:hypothetical protein